MGDLAVAEVRRFLAGEPLAPRGARRGPRSGSRDEPTALDDPRANPDGGQPARAPRTTCGGRWSTSSSRSSATSRPAAHGRASAASARRSRRASPSSRATPRPLWGIVPLVAGGGTFAHWDRWVAGLANGTDPESAEYWGPCGDGHRPAHGRDGRDRVRARRSRPSTCGTRSPGASATTSSSGCAASSAGEPAQNNWQFFRLLVQMGLERVGVADRPRGAGAFGRAARLVRRRRRLVHRRRGRQHRLLRAVRVPHLRPRPRRVRVSATATRPSATSSARDAFAPEFQHWFAADGARVPVRPQPHLPHARRAASGARSRWPTSTPSTGRRCAASRCGTSAGGATRPISDRDGVVSVGYGYDNRRMAESYNSAGSPYWCMKAFAMLAAPDDHPFWTVAEAAPPPPATVTLPHARHGDRTRRRPGGRADGAAAGVVVRRAGRRRSTTSSRTRAGSASAATSTCTDSAATDSMLAVTDPATGVRRVRDGVRAQRGRRRRRAHALVAAARRARRHRAQRRRALARARPPRHRPTASSSLSRDRVRARRGSPKASDAPAPDDPDARPCRRDVAVGRRRRSSTCRDDDRRHATRARASR